MGGRGQRQVASVAMYLEQELGAASHAAADLERHHCTLGFLAADDAVDDKLVGRSLRDHSSGILRQDTVPLADGERSQFAKFAEAVAEPTDLVADGERHQIG